MEKTWKPDFIVWVALAVLAVYVGLNAVNSTYINSEFVSGDFFRTFAAVALGVLFPASWRKPKPQVPNDGP